MNKLSYHLILVNSSLRVLIDQLEQLCKCLEQQGSGVSGQRSVNINRPSFAEASAGNPKVYEKLRIEKTSIQNTVYEKIKRTRKGIAFKQIQKKTGFNRTQIANAIYKLKERNMIEAKSRGIYIKSGRSIK